jgi:2-succinyl-6-hydroxy-2,4-cyclohexadiene-1-carboxylate synthase
MTDSPTIVFLHGFLSKPDMWNDIVYNLKKAGFKNQLLCPELKRYLKDGSSDVNSDFLSVVHEIAQEFSSSGGCLLVGYSMGARIALSLLIEYAGLFTGALLIGVNPGISEEGERVKRKKWEQELVAFLLDKGIDEFVLHWENMPLFKTQKSLEPAVKLRQRQMRTEHSCDEIVKAILKLGLSSMPDYWPELKNIKVPVWVITGELDSKYSLIAKNMSAIQSNFKQVIIKKCGHNPVIENPSELSAVLLNIFIDELKLTKETYCE